MRRDIKSYVETCTRCHQVKAPRYKPYGELVSLPVRQGPRQNWTIDFITDLPRSFRRGQVYVSILVTIDRYTKFSRYIPARKDWEAENMSDVLVEEIFTKFGMPVSIVTDRGSLSAPNSGRTSVINSEYGSIIAQPSILKPIGRRRDKTEPQNST